MTVRDVPIGPLERSGPPEGPRISLVVPATDQVSEAAFAEMLAGHPVSVVTSRVAFENPVVMATLSRMVDDLARATALLLPGARIDWVLNEYPENILMGPLEPGARPDFPDRRDVPA
jgi:maleate cis-trans isomerase